MAGRGVGIGAASADVKVVPDVKEDAALLDLYRRLARKIPEQMLSSHAQEQEQELDYTELPILSTKDLENTTDNPLISMIQKAMRDTNHVLEEKQNETSAEYDQRIRRAKECIEKTHDKALAMVLNSMKRPTHRLMAYPFPDSKSSREKYTELNSQRYTELMKGSGNEWLWQTPPREPVLPVTAAKPKARK